MTTPSKQELVKPAGKQRHCWHCGADMGFIENRFYDSRDTCGSAECERSARDADQQERDEAHEQLDREMGWY